MNECPFCGAKSENGHLFCQTYKMKNNIWKRSSYCHSIEMDKFKHQQAALLRRALEVVEDLMLTTYPDMPGRFALRLLKAQTLAPDLRAALNRREEG